MDQATIASLIEELSSSARRARHQAAHELALVAEEDPALLVPYADAMIDGLSRPEAQTRWELLNALAAMSAVDPSACAPGIDEGETALFDEDSSMVRLAAFRYLSAVGASAPERSEAVWPLLDEAVQVYHGDGEFRDMLVALLGFVQGNISAEVRQEVVERVEFDAKNSTMPFIKKYCTQIVQAAKAEA